MRFSRLGRRVLRAALPGIFCGLSIVATASGAIRYEIAFPKPEQHLFHVTIQIPDVKNEVVVQMAAWNALYQIRDFSAHVQRVEAFAGDESAGYHFSLSGCEGNPASKFQVTAEPIESDAGMKAFCADESGTVRFDPKGKGNTCLSRGQVLSPTVVSSSAQEE